MSQPIRSRLLLAVATIVTIPAIAPPTAAQAATAVTCQATISLAQGASLTYRLSGTVANRSTSGPTHPIGTSLLLTVTKRHQSGQVQTLLSRASANDYEQVAPDADYSRLPFSDGFRGQPNDGFRLYSVQGATHGLYVSLRPIDGQPQKFQIVHYLSAGKFVRSSGGTCQKS